METFFFLEQLCYSDTFTLFDEKKILARGELLSTAMMLRHLEDRGVRAVGLPALEYMRTNKQAEPDEALYPKPISRSSSSELPRVRSSSSRRATSAAMPRRYRQPAARG